MIHDSSHSPRAKAASNWYAVPVRSAFEKSVCHAFADRALDAFSPTYITKRLWSDRAVDIEVPLFPGYVFCALPPSYSPSLISVEGVAQQNGSTRKAPIPTDFRQLHAIRLLTSLGCPLTPWPYLSHATNVEITEGRLCGVAGIVISPGKLVVSLTALQRSILADIRGENFIRIAATAGTR